MEKIETKFSPNDWVYWERDNSTLGKKGNTDMISQHKVSSIRIDIHNSYKWGSIEAKTERFKGGWFSFMALIITDSRKSSNYGKKANECFKKIRNNRTIEMSGIEIEIFYILENVNLPIKESELRIVPIDEL